MSIEDFLEQHWRIANLYKIVDKQSRYVQFRPNRIQQLINQCTAPRKMILKPRQIGSTTLETIKLLDKTVFHRNQTSCIIAHESDAIKKIFRIPRRAYDSMPAIVKPQLDKGGGSKYEMSFPEIRSRIYCDLESRGDTINNLHISEAAFVEFERYMSTMQAVPIDTGAVTIESTANGVGNWFYDMWVEENGYAKLFYPWFFDPTYCIEGIKINRTSEEKEFVRFAKKKYKIEITDPQLAFRRAKQIELKDKYLQEYPEDETTCFLLSGGAVIDRQVISELLKKVSQPVQEIEDVKIFKPRKVNRRYLIGADTAQGTGKDWSVGVCYDVASREEVAILRCKTSPFNFARKLKAFADLFTSSHRLPLLAVENNNHGHAVLQELYEHIQYPNLYQAKPGTLGWVTNSVTRPIMLNQFIDAVSLNAVKINSRETLNECLTLVDINGKIQAAEGKNDDCVIAHAIAIHLMAEEASKIGIYEDVRSSILV